MQLYEARKFALNDLINATLLFPVRIPDYRQDITLRNPSTRVGAIILANQSEAELDDIWADAYRFGLSLSGG